MALLLDTGPLELLRRRDRRVESLALQYYPPVLPLAAVGEFLYGQLLAEVVPEALMQAQKFVAGFEILPSNTTTALIYARLRSQNKRRGRMIPDPDYWIAALAVQHRMRLVTTDSHFECFDELQPWLVRVSA